MPRIQEPHTARSQEGSSNPLQLFKHLSKLEEEETVLQSQLSQGKNGQRWLLPYADMLTGLFVLMLTLYAFSNQQLHQAQLQVERYKAALATQSQEAPAIDGLSLSPSALAPRR